MISKITQSYPSKTCHNFGANKFIMNTINPSLKRHLLFMCYIKFNIIKILHFPYQFSYDTCLSTIHKGLKQNSACRMKACAIFYKNYVYQLLVTTIKIQVYDMMFLIFSIIVSQKIQIVNKKH